MSWLLKTKPQFLPDLWVCVGLTSILLFVTTVVWFEMSFENFNPNRDRTFRLNEVQFFNPPDSQIVALTMYPMGPYLTSSMPDVVGFTRLQTLGEVFVSYQEKQGHAFGIFADTSFFNVLGFRISHAGGSTPLKEKSQAVITEDFSIKYFGSPENSIGKSLMVYSNKFTVVGVVENPPLNSHLQFDLLLSRVTIEVPLDAIDWTKNNFITYVQVNDAASIENIAHGMEQFEADFLEDPDLYNLYLQPVAEVHRGSVNLVHDPINNSKSSLLQTNFIFLALTVFALVTFLFNLVLLDKIFALHYPLNKVVVNFGAFYLLTVIIAAPIAYGYGMVLFSEPLIWAAQTPWFWRTCGLCILAFGMAVVLAGILKSRFSNSHQNFSDQQHRKRYATFAVVSVTILLAVSVGLLIPVSRSLNKSYSNTIGGNSDDLFIVPLSSRTGPSIRPIKAKLDASENVLATTLTVDLPLGTIHQRGVEFEGLVGKTELVASTMQVGDKFFDFFEVKLISGRAFSSSIFLETQGAYIINRKLCNMLGWDPNTAIGKSISIRGNPRGTLIGVIDDFNFLPTYVKNGPLILTFGNEPLNFLIRCVPGQQDAVFSELAASWATRNDEPLRVQTLKSRLEKAYHPTHQFLTICVFTCLGCLIYLFLIANKLRRAHPTMIKSGIIITVFSILTVIYLLSLDKYSIACLKEIPAYELGAIFILIATTSALGLFSARFVIKQPWLASRRSKLPSNTLPILLLLTILGCDQVKKEKPLQLVYDKNASAQLGKTLFIDPSFSRNGKVSCASCHIPEFGFSDTTAFSTGFSGVKTKRNTPTVTYMNGRSIFFWDGRASSLRTQALMPLIDPHEMGMTYLEIENRLLASPHYSHSFQQIFSRPPDVDLVSICLADFQSTLSFRSSPYDKYVTHRDSSEISESALRGMRLFFGKANCNKCHQGSDFSDDEFRNLGLPGTDSGRFDFTRKAEDIYKFKTPHLRNVELTAPYMHDGSLKTLREVLNFYNNPLSSIVITENIDSLILVPLNLNNQELDDLEDFMKALTDTQFKSGSGSD